MGTYRCTADTNRYLFSTVRATVLKFPYSWLACETPPCTYFHLFATRQMITEQLQIENACHTTDSGSNTAYSMGSNAIFLSSAQNAVNKNLRHTPEGEALGK